MARCKERHHLIDQVLDRKCPGTHRHAQDILFLRLARGDLALLLEHHLTTYSADGIRRLGDLAIAPHGNHAYKITREDQAENAECSSLPRRLKDLTVGSRELGIGVFDGIEGFVHAGDADNVKGRAVDPFGKGNDGGAGSLFGVRVLEGMLVDGAGDGFDHVAREAPESWVKVFDVAVGKR